MSAVSDLSRDLRRIASADADYRAAYTAACASQIANRLDHINGIGHKAQDGCALVTLSLGDAEVLVEYEYTEGEDSQTSGPPELCHEGSPEEITLIGVLCNGQWIDADRFSDAQIARWMQDITDREQAVRDDQQADRAEREVEYY